MSSPQQPPLPLHDLLSPEEVENLDYLDRMDYALEVIDARREGLLTDVEVERYRIACMSVSDRRLHYMVEQHFGDREKRGLKMKELQDRLRISVNIKNIYIAGALLVGIVIGYLLAWLLA